MTEIEYQESVLKRFKKVRKKLDKTIEDYIVIEFDKKRDSIYKNTYSFLSELFSDYDDYKSKDPNYDEDFETKLDKNYSGVLCGVSFSSLTFEFGRYTRITPQKSENFTYFEVYNKYGITSILVKSDMAKEVLIRVMNLNDLDYKMLNEQVKFGFTYLNIFNKKKRYEHNWINEYHFNEEELFSDSNADAILNCPDPKLVYTIAGYAILAYMFRIYKFHNKIMALNIVTDKKSVGIIHKLIQKCFVNCGYNDNIGVIVFDAKAKAEIYYPNCEDRCIVIDAMSSQSKDALPSMLNKYYLYIRETTRNVEYPYLFLPIILTSEQIGEEFYTIEATGLFENQERWTQIYEAIHRFYKYPIDINYMRKYLKDSQAIVFIDNFYKIFDTIYKRNCEKFFIPYSDYPVYKHGMDIMLNSCCNLVCFNIELPVEPYSLYSREKTQEICRSVNANLSISNRKDKYNDNKDLALNIVNFPIVEVIDKINDQINEEEELCKPDIYDENEPVKFTHKCKYFGEKCFCFNEKYFIQCIEELEMDQNGMGHFINDFDALGLLIRDGKEGRKKIKVSIGNTKVRLYALKAHEDTGLLFTPDEIAEMKSKGNHDRSSEG